MAEVIGQRHAPAALIQGNSSQYALDRTLGEAQSRSKCYGVERNSYHSRGSNHGRPARRLYYLRNSGSLILFKFVENYSFSYFIIRTKLQLNPVWLHKYPTGEAKAKAVPLHATKALGWRGRIAPAHSRTRYYTWFNVQLRPLTTQ
jgi:hypothetical protein